METLYLDWNATAPLRNEARKAMLAAMELTGNPSSVHGPGRKARAVIEHAREQVGALAGIRARDVIFTSGGTEANNLALLGAGADVIITTPVEHDSVLAAANTSGADVILLSVNADGMLELESLKESLAQARGRVLVSVMAANNETGALQPVAEAAEMAHAAGAWMHTDAIQVPGRMLLDFAGLGVDMMSLSAHKMGGPKGAGALLVKPEIALTAQISGGGQELRRRSGTENVTGIAGFGAAAEAAMGDPTRYKVTEKVRDALEDKIAAICPDVAVFSKNTARLPNTSMMAMPGVSAETQVMHFDLEQIAVTSGSACSSGKVEKSHVLDAMGAGPLAGEAIRVSFGPDAKMEEAECMAAAWEKLYKRVQKRAVGA